MLDFTYVQVSLLLWDVPIIACTFRNRCEPLNVPQDGRRIPTAANPQTV